MDKVKFYRCEHCGNLVERIHDGGASLVCCGEKMTALKPNTVDASAEKHLPVVKREAGAVRVHVGSAEHPMIPEHAIQWIGLEMERGMQRAILKPGQAPDVTFLTGESKPVTAYAYCNIHGLWMSEV